MGDSVKYYFDQDFGEEKELKTEEKNSEEIVNILKLFKKLSLADKITVKSLIKNANLFAE